jgi:hypothetical protein
MVNVDGEPRIRIAIVENIAIGENIARTNLLPATMRNKSKIDPAKQHLKDHT